MTDPRIEAAYASLLTTAHDHSMPMGERIRLMLAAADAASIAGAGEDEKMLTSVAADLDDVDRPVAADDLRRAAAVLDAQARRIAELENALHVIETRAEAQPLAGGAVAAYAKNLAGCGQIARAALGKEAKDGR